LPIDPGLRNEVWALARLALPVVTAQLGMIALGVVDTVMVGHFSGEALAAVALGNIVSFGSMILGMGTLQALDPLVAQAWGAGDRASVSASLQRALVLAAIMSVPYMLLFQYTAPLLRALGQRDEVIAVAAPFVRALTPSVPAFFGFVAVRQTLQAMSVVRPVVIAVVTANLANAAGNWILIYGKLGAPALGVLGSAWSTTICRWVMLAVLVLASWPALAEVWRRPDARLRELRPYWRMLAIGVPIGLQSGLEMWVFTAAGLLIGSMGALALASHQIALNLASLSFMVPLGIGQAAATRVGNAIGRRDHEGARRAAWVALAFGASVMIVSASLFFTLPLELAALYTGDAGVGVAAAHLIAIAALFQIFDGTQAVGCGILRGAADTRAAAAINFVGYWVLGLPIGWTLAFRLGLGPRGLWWGLTTGLAVVAALLVLRVRWRFRGALPTVVE
jgi:MATE family multidrug resistance protein